MKSGVTLRHRAALSAALAVVALLGLALSVSAEPTAGLPPEPSDIPARTIAPIPIPEVAQRAEQVATVLRAADGTPADLDGHDAEVELAATRDWIRAHIASTTDALAASPSSNALANLTYSWHGTRFRLATLNNMLTRRARLVEERVEQLETMQATWAATRASARESGAPATVLSRIDETMATIATARRNAATRLTYVLGLQDTAAKQIARCDDVLATIAQTGKALDGPALARDALPIWSPEARTKISSELDRRLLHAVADIVDLIKDFVVSNRARVPIHVALLVVVIVLAHLARRGARRRPDKDPSETAAAQVFELPFSSALVVALFATVWIYPQPPRVVVGAVGLLVLVPVLRIVRRLAAPGIVPAVDALAAFFLVDRVRDLCSAAPLLEQWLFLLEMVFGIVFVALVIRSERLLRATGNAAVLQWRWLIAALLWSQLALLVVAVFEGALGYMRLARLLGGAVLASNYVALVLYAGVRVGEGLLAYALRSRPLRALFIVQRYRPVVRRRLTLGLGGLAAAWWAYFTLDGLGVMRPMWSAATAVLGARYVRGSISVSIGDVVAFVLTIVAAFVASAFVRVVLREDVYPRLRLPRGAAYALSSLVHYAVILIGFIVAVAAVGIDLNRIALVAGALGVGVGIGLQNVVANFVSGLILLLERRIHIGDTVQLGDLEGQVREIGSRASTIRTWDGADVIVPNAILTSQRITNWTFSDRLRRVQLDVGVAYTADPERVLEILRNVARAHPKALAEPAPVAVCTGFGDSALRVTLRVWTVVDDAESVLSQLAIAVRGAFSAAKIEIPFPQRDVHIVRNGDR